MADINWDEVFGKIFEFHQNKRSKRTEFPMPEFSFNVSQDSQDSTLYPTLEESNKRNADETFVPFNSTRMKKPKTSPMDKTQSMSLVSANPNNIFQTRLMNHYETLNDASPFNSPCTPNVIKNLDAQTSYYCLTKTMMKSFHRSTFEIETVRKSNVSNFRSSMMNICEPSLENDTNKITTMIMPVEEDEDSEQSLEPMGEAESLDFLPSSNINHENEEIQENKKEESHGLLKSMADFSVDTDDVEKSIVSTSNCSKSRKSLSLRSIDNSIQQSEKSVNVPKKIVNYSTDSAKRLSKLPSFDSGRKSQKFHSKIVEKENVLPQPKKWQKSIVNYSFDESDHDSFIDEDSNNSIQHCSTKRNSRSRSFTSKIQENREKILNRSSGSGTKTNSRNSKSRIFVEDDDESDVDYDKEKNYLKFFQGHDEEIDSSDESLSNSDHHSAAIDYESSKSSAIDPNPFFADNDSASFSEDDQDSEVISHENSSRHDTNVSSKSVAIDPNSFYDNDSEPFSEDDQDSEVISHENSSRRDTNVSSKSVTIDPNSFSDNDSAPFSEDDQDPEVISYENSSRHDTNVSSKSMAVDPSSFAENVSGPYPEDDQDSEMMSYENSSRPENNASSKSLSVKRNSIRYHRDDKENEQGVESDSSDIHDEDNEEINNNVVEAISMQTLRRSNRNRMKPCDYWRGQRPIYKFENNRCNGQILPIPTIVGVSHGTDLARLRRRRVVVNKKPKQNNLPIPAETNPKPSLKAILDLSIHDKKTEISTDTDCEAVKHLDKLNFVPSINSKGVYCAVSKKAPNERAFGMIKFESFARKKKSKVTYSTNFTVLYGVLSFTIDKKSTIVVPTGSQIEIDPSQSYSIKNLRNDEALVHFCLFRDK